MKLIKSLKDKFKGLSKGMKIIVVVIVIPVALFGGIVVYATSTVLIDTVLGTDISKTVNNEEYQKEQEMLKIEKEQSKKEDNNKTSLINEIILSQGHPIYYGNIENAIPYAKKIGKKFISVDIVGGDKYSKYTDDTVLVIRGYEYNGLITDIQIYPNNINESMDTNKAIDLANKYLPADIIKKYYKQPTGEIYTPEDKSKNIYKVIEYDFNEVGDKEREDDEFKYRSNIYVTLEEENNKVMMIRIHHELPNWMMRSEFNGYKVEEWSINN